MISTAPAGFTGVSLNFLRSRLVPSLPGTAKWDGRVASVVLMSKVGAFIPETVNTQRLETVLVVRLLAVSFAVDDIDAVYRHRVASGIS
jgi:hypothetical protein